MAISRFVFFKRYGAAICFVSLFFLFQALPVFSASPEKILTQKALSLNLQNHRYWRALLHYKSTLLGVKSNIDDPKFFLAPNGNKDALAELTATIHFLFGPQANKDAVYRFYARYRWLKEQLDPDNALLPDIRCEKIEAVFPGPVSVIFPTYFLNNPASMFGHTLLTIGSENKNIRLANAVNYGARVDTNNGVNFAIRGVFGLFKGYYSVMPYYKKIQEYSDGNQRDIWEYRLNLSEKESRRLIWHLAELNNIYLDYYFFQKNCSYNLLYVLEVARPTLNLVSRFKTVVMPIDTVKAMKEENLIESVEFRPSKTTLIKARKDMLAPHEQKVAIQLIDTKQPETLLQSASNNKTTQARMLELATDLLRLNLVEKQISGKHYKTRLLKLLRLRSSLGKRQTEPEITLPQKPDMGHDSNKITVGSGFTFRDNEKNESFRQSDFFSELRFRPAFTDLTDPDYIEDKGAKIEFLDTRARYYSKAKKLRLQQLEIVDITSISPRDEIFTPISWKVSTGLKQKATTPDKDYLVYQLNTGSGLAYNLFSPKVILYGMPEIQGEAGNSLKKGYDAGLGFCAGLLVAPFENAKMHLFSRYTHFFVSDSTLFEAKLSNNIKLSKNIHLTLDLSYEKGEVHETAQSVLSFGLFF